MIASLRGRLRRVQEDRVVVEAAGNGAVELDAPECEGWFDRSVRDSGAIIVGAGEIGVPAFVATICICIVFVPMFFLTGVARFLFVPMAEAVMFAMIWSFILSRTLVPTMAKYLL